MAGSQGELLQAALYQLRSLLVPPMPRGQDDFQGLPEAASGAVMDRTGPAPAHGPGDANEAISSLLAWRYCRDDFHPTQLKQVARSFIFVVKIEVNTRQASKREMNSFGGKTDVDCRFADGVASELHLVRR
jgi:hypothetical protein